MRRLTVALGLATLVLAMFAVPVSAEVHEIVGQRCSGHETIHPPGISGGSNADNLARPLIANGFVLAEVPHVGPEGPGIWIQFDFDHPASKIAPTEDPPVPQFFGMLEVNGEEIAIYVDGHAVDLEHPHTNCKHFQ